MPAKEIQAEKTVARDPSKPKTTFDLNSIGKKIQRPPEKAVEPVVTEPQLQKPLQEDDLQRVWNEFAELKKNQVAEYQLLKRPWTLQDNQVVITLSNPIEEPLLNNMRTSLIAFLRDKLSHSSIMVTSVLQEVESKRQLYTNKEKFDYLLAKNPQLAVLKERFGLDPEF